MQSFSNPSSTRKKIRYVFISLFVLSVLIFLFKKFPIVEFFQGEMQKVVSSQKSFMYSLGRPDESETIEKLKKENQDLIARLSQFEITGQDNVALRSQFETSGKESLALSHAKILGFTGNRSIPDTLVINVGKGEGVKIGMPVVSQKYMVGKITEVSNNFSVVTTIISPKFQALVKVPSTNANGILFGNRDFTVLDRVAITDKLEKGSIVVTRGEVNNEGVGIFPDLIIGKLSSVFKNESAPFQGGQVAPIIDFSRLTNVFVIVSL